MILESDAIISPVRSNYVLVFIRRGSGKVYVAGVTPHPDQVWMTQMVCKVMMEEWGFLAPG